MKFLRNVDWIKVCLFLLASVVITIQYTNEFKSNYNSTNQLRSALDRHIAQEKSIEPMDITVFAEHLTFPINEMLSIWPDELELCLKNSVVIDKDVLVLLPWIRTSSTTNETIDLDDFGLIKLTAKSKESQVTLKVKMNRISCIAIPSERGRLSFYLENIGANTVLDANGVPLISIKAGNSELYVQVSFLTIVKLTFTIFLLLSFVADSIVSICEFYKKRKVAKL